MAMIPASRKIYAFCLVGNFCGVAGGLHAYLWRGVGFESFTLHHSISYLAMAIVGGLGTLGGFFWFGRHPGALELQVEAFSEFVGHHVTAVGDVATAFELLSFCPLIVLFLMFEPRWALPIGGGSAGLTLSRGPSAIDGPYDGIAVWSL